ncbi:MAG: AMP-binding protein [Pseudomonadota bacterium]
MTLWQALASHAVSRPGKVALAAPDATLTYGGLANASQAAARCLRDRHGLRRQDRIAYLGYNSAAQIVLTFAAACGGHVVSPLNWRLSEGELAWIVANADPSLIVADPVHMDIARRVAPGRALSPASELISDTVSEDWRPDVIELGGSADPLLLVYTSGATGRPKGAVLSQSAVRANAELSWDMHDMTAADRILTALPMFHVGGLNIQTMPALLIGATVDLMDRFDPDTCLGLIADRRPTLTVQVPATLQALMAADGWDRADLSSLRAITTGSTDVPVPLISSVHRRGVPVIQIYGATETGPVVVYQKAEHAKTHIGSIGKPGPGVDVSLRTGDGAEAANGAPGEVWLRSPTLASGYWRDDGHAAFAGGWFRTGDVARLDDEGFLWFTDRVKNVIISGGENIYPAELERVLRKVPGVTEAAVVGIADEKWGSVPVAAVVSNGPVTSADVRAVFDRDLARFKHPKAVHFVDALPRNAMGKVVPAEVKTMIEAASQAG